VLENALHVSAKSAENSARAHEKPALVNLASFALINFFAVFIENKANFVLTKMPPSYFNQNKQWLLLHKIDSFISSRLS
jgi:hypothetical protein